MSIITRKEWRETLDKAFKEQIVEAYVDLLEEATLMEREMCIRACETVMALGREGGTAEYWVGMCIDAIKKRDTTAKVDDTLRARGTYFNNA